MKTLLAIINEKTHSKKFIEYTFKLSKDLEMKLHLLYVQNPDMYPLGYPEAAASTTAYMQGEMEEIGEQVKNKLIIWVNEIKKEISEDLPVEISSEMGNSKLIAEELLENNKIDMIALDSLEDFSMWAPNPVNNDIIFNTSCPVWVIPYDATYEPFRKIMYATNYNEEDIATIKKLVKIAHVYSPEIVTLHITESNDFEEKVKTAGFLDKVKEKTGYDDIAVHSILERENDNVAQLINDYSTDIDSNLVVVLKENKGFLERLFRSSSTKKLVKEAKLPLLVFHEEE